MKHNLKKYCGYVLVLLLINVVSLQLAAQVVPTTDTMPQPVSKFNPWHNPVFDIPPSINYIRSKTFSEPIPYDQMSWAASDTLPIRNAKVTTQYYDSFGRLLQTVHKQLSPDGKDIASQIAYDDFGRAAFHFMPYETDSSHGKFLAGFFDDHHWRIYNQYFPNAHYPNDINGDDFYYSETQYEPSPRNRVLKNMSPGNAWVGSDRGTGFAYEHNQNADSVLIWAIGLATQSYPHTTGIYHDDGIQDQGAVLYKTITTDVNGHRLVEFKDKQGKVILKKQQAAGNAGDSYTGWFSTYYVYDDFGRLRYVIPPEAVNWLRANSWNFAASGGSQVRAELCFQYEYDGRGRMILKKVPGAAEQYLVYDKRNRLVFSQDGNQRANDQWLVTYYDGLDRPVETAVYTDAGATRQSLQDMMDALAGGGGSGSCSQIPAPDDLVVSSRTGNEPAEYIARNSITFMPGFEAPAGDEFTATIDPNAMIDDPNCQGEGGGGSSSGSNENPIPPISLSLVSPLTYTYYDNYSWSGHLSFNLSYLNKTTDGDNPYAEDPNPYDTYKTYSRRTHGMVTGSKVKVLGSAPEQWLTTTIFYDERGRVLQTLSENSTGGVDAVTNKYDFSGKVLSTYTVVHNNHSTLTPETDVLTEYKYDDAGRLLKITKTLNGASAGKVIAQYSYSQLGKLKTKTLAPQQGGAGGGLETLNYEYTVRDWLRGINRQYANGHNNDHFFGMVLNYEYGFSQKQYDGNIAGEIWRSSGDGERRAYGFSYDVAGRLSKADFTQYNSGWNTSAGVDYSVSNLSYDANGNINSLNRKGLINTSSGTVDNLTYGYQTYSNQLNHVTDNGGTSAALSDFKDGHTGSGDYSYDVNGNLEKDLNKGISSITYNHLNLPETVNFGSKGNIRFVYDATGNKLQKIVTDETGSTTKTTVTSYISGFVYQHTGSTAQDTLQFFPTEEGRVRYVPADGSTAAYYTYDYFIKDHLGNTRVVLTEQTDFSQYMATMEQQNAQTEDALFYNLNSTRTPKPVDYPQDNITTPNQAVAKLNGSDPDKRIGPSIILKVMAGDTIQAAVRAYYKQETDPKKKASIPAEQMLAGLLQAFTAPAVQPAATHSARLASNAQTTGPGLTANDLQSLRQKNPDNKEINKPKAYLNYVFFDKRLNFVEEGSGIKQVDGEAGELETLNSGKVVAKENGYVYVFTSNESSQDVLFDNFGVTQITGPVLEETHYYPFGLTMSGISTKAPLKLENRFKYNGKELNHKEFSDGSGLEWYDYGARMYDVQIGRFFTMDPHTDNYNNWTTYNYVADNPINLFDPNGMDWATGLDKQIANNLRGQLTNRMLYLNTRFDDLDRRIMGLENEISSGNVSEGRLKRLRKRLDKAEAKQWEIGEMISDVFSSISEIEEMGKTKKMTFTFKDLGADKGKGFLSTKVVKNGTSDAGRLVTVINYTYSSSDITGGSKYGNMLHEATHGYQFLKGYFSQATVNRGTDLFSYPNNNVRWAAEAQAYQRQYSLSGPFPSGSNLYVPNYDAIGVDFVKGIKAHGQLVYPSLK